MSEKNSLFQKLNAPFPYSEYRYDSFGDRCYISGQSVTERLNEIIGVGYWKYEGLHDTEKVLQDSNGKNPRIKIFVRFSFYNDDLKEWISFVDVGSEQIKPGMHEGDATKSAITDGMKKCASRLGVGSDVYKGLITWDKQEKRIVIPNHYQLYYENNGLDFTSATPTINNKQPTTSNNTKKSVLTAKLKNRPSATYKQMQEAWQQLAGSLDGFDEWVKKKDSEQVTEEQMLQMLQKKMSEKKNAKSD
jgi:hypothetical protein